ncbi:MAG: hypothetical protein AAGF15_05685 [Pseudomonadota bacterium]
MATKKRSILTTTYEWARHLRPAYKREFWRGERRAEEAHLRHEIEEATAKDDNDNGNTR